ncbi:MAG TPA: hypothetical protein VHZ74_15630 [Bryobacteraceae bacterium]|nr:hypothetical protein [Bryobacteraceae bacterium]
MPGDFLNPTTRQIAAFLQTIGLSITCGEVSGTPFLPGIQIRGGMLTIDEARLKWPGDLLHEAGHLAITPANRRALIDDDKVDDPGEELGAIAWSWAALIHLRLAPEVVFHPGGYRGGSESIIENFRERRYTGVPYLRWIGLAADDYPAMIHWLRD